MQYIYLDKNIVQAMYVDDDPVFPIEKRFPASYLMACMQIEDTIEVQVGWEYKNGEFHPVEYIPVPITLQDHRDAAMRRLEGCCSGAIYGGCDITCSVERGRKHYSFPDEAQRAVSLMFQGTVAGNTVFSYKADDEQYNIYTTEEVKVLFKAMGNWITVNTKYKEVLVSWIAAEKDTDVLDGIKYGSNLPTAYMTTLVAYLTELGINVNDFAANLIVS